MLTNTKYKHNEQIQVHQANLLVKTLKSMKTTKFSVLMGKDIHKGGLISLMSVIKQDQKDVIHDAIELGKEIRGRVWKKQ